MRRTILCEPGRRGQGQGGVGSGEDRAGKPSNKAATDDDEDNSANTLGTELGFPGSGGDPVSQQWGTQREDGCLLAYKVPSAS